MIIESAVAIVGGSLTLMYLNGKDKRRIKNLWRETLLNCKAEGVKLKKTINNKTIYKTYMLSKMYPKDYGWFAIANIPTGLTFDALNSDNAKNALEDAFGCKIEMEKEVDSKNRTFIKVKFILKFCKKEYKPVKPPKFGMMFLGYNQDGTPHFLNLMHNPHILISGLTGKGKTVLMCTVMTNLIYYWHDLIDLYLSQIEKSDSYYFSDCKAVRSTGYTLQETLANLKKAEEWMKERQEIFTALNIIDVSQYNEKVTRKMKLKIFIIEEYSFYMPSDNDSDKDKELKNDCRTIIDKIIKTGRGYGIHFFSVLQRTTHTNINTDIRSQLFRISFKQASEEDSKNAVGNTQAYKLDADKFEFYAGGNVNKVLLSPYVDKGFDILRKYLPELKSPRHDLIEKLNKNELTIQQLISKKDITKQKEETEDINIYNGLTKEEQALLYYKRNGYIAKEYEYLVEDDKKKVDNKPEVTSSKNKNRKKFKKNDNEVISDANA